VIFSTDKSLEYYKNTILHHPNIEFAKKILSDQRDFYQKLRGSSSTANILFQAHPNLCPDKDFVDLYHYIKLLRISEVDFNVEHEHFQKLVKNIARAVELDIKIKLYNSNGKNIETLYHKSRADIENSLKKNEFLPIEHYVRSEQITEAFFDNTIAANDDA